MFDAIDYINKPRWQKVSLGLARTKALLKLLGNPQDSLKFIHVAGTNGKGSTCAFLESIFRVSGFRTGLFTSPYVQVFNERIRVDNENITDEELSEITLRVKDAAEQVKRDLGEHPTEFELMTAVAFCYFLEKRCDIVICEVGLGGRLDSTNVINPDVIAITKIGLDHMAILGNTLEEIAREKAGIIKPNVPVVTCTQDKRAMKVIDEVAKKNNSQVFIANENEVSDCRLKMRGSFQPQNAAVAKKVADVYAKNFARKLVPDMNLHSDSRPCKEVPDITSLTIKKGLEQAFWLGRFEFFEENLPPSVEAVIVDGAHNACGARALKASLSSEKDLQDKNLIGVFGALKDKVVKGVLVEIAPVFSKIVVYSPDSPRAMGASELFELAAANFRKDAILRAKSATSALDAAFELANSATHSQGAEKNSRSVIICFGSLYSVGALRQKLLKL